MELYTCHLVDDDYYLSDGSTIRVCLTDHRDYADIWICPVDRGTSADIKVEIVKSYENPQYTAYLCSPVEYSYKKEELKIEREKDYNYMNEIFDESEEYTGSTKAEQESNQEKTEDETYLISIQAKYKRYLEMKKNYPRTIVFYILALAIGVFFIYIGVDGVISSLKKRIRDASFISDFIEVSLSWILTAAFLIGGIAILIYATICFKDYKEEYSELKYKFEN